MTGALKSSHDMRIKFASLIIDNHGIFNRGTYE